MLGPEEADDLAAHGVTLMTPCGRWGRFLDGTRLGISAGTFDERHARDLGLSTLHLTDATRVLARHALVAGADLVFGGALELEAPLEDSTNLVSALFEMIGSYNRAGTVQFPPLENYAAWPFWHGVSLDWLARRRHVLRVNKLPAPAAAGALAEQALSGVLETARGRALVGISLSSMRRQIASATSVRIVLGGARQGALGMMPGVVEETLLALAAEQPTYILGGFGGGAGVVAEAILGREPEALTLAYQCAHGKGYEETLAAYDAQRAEDPELPAVDYPAMASRLAATGVGGLAANNGLTDDENRRLLTTRSLDEAVHLVMTGLYNRFASAPC